MLRAGWSALQQCGGTSRHGEAHGGAALELSEARESVKANEGSWGELSRAPTSPREPKHGVDTQHPCVDLLLPSVGHGHERVEHFEL
jgi:hypothetical protein